MLTSPGQSRAQSGRSLRVVMVVEAMLGGVREHVLQLAQGLNQRAWEVHLVVSQDRADGAFHAALPDLIASGIRLHPVTMKRNPLMPANQLAVARIARLLRQLRPDVVHTHAAIAGAVGRAAAFLAGAPVVIYSPHGGSLHDMFGPMRWTYSAVEKLLEGQTSAIILISEWLKSRCVEVVGCSPGKMVVVPIGIDPQLFPVADAQAREAARRQLGLAPDSPVLTCIGLLRPIKGQDLLVRAFRQVWEEFPKAKLLLVGEGEMRQHLEELIRDLRLGSAVWCTGFVPDILPYLHATDVYLHPTRGDASSYSVMQAMAAGLPVVASAVAALPEIVHHGETGLLVPGGDPEAMASAIRLLIERPGDRQKMGAAGRRRILEHFQVESMIRHTEQIYREKLGVPQRTLAATVG